MNIQKVSFGKIIVRLRIKYLIKHITNNTYARKSTDLVTSRYKGLNLFRTFLDNLFNS